MTADLSPAARATLPEVIAALRHEAERVINRRGGRQTGVALHTAAEWLEAQR